MRRKRKKEKLDADTKIIYLFCALAIIACTACDYIWGDEPEQVQAEQTQEVVAEYREQEPLFNVELEAPIQRFVITVCNYYEIEPSLVMALIEKESGFDTACIGDNGESYGLMQVQARWHIARMENLGVSDLLNPYENIEVGVNVLSEKLDAGNGLEWALMAYNGGNQYANKMTEAGKISEYASTIIERAAELEAERYAE